MSSSMIWHRPRSDRWISACGRYDVTKSRGTGEALLLCVHFYGFLVTRMEVPRFSADLPTTTRDWCEHHRQRALPLVSEFERWVGAHYQVNVAQHACGPLGRRDLVQQLIKSHGDGNLGLHWHGAGHMTIQERFAAIYQSISPEPMEPENERTPE